MAPFFHGLINCMISTQTFTSLDCVREEGVKLKKKQRIGDDLHNVSRGAIGSNWVQRFFFVFVQALKKILMSRTILPINCYLFLKGMPFCLLFSVGFMHHLYSLFLPIQKVFNDLCNHCTMHFS
jgi:hypothetical protein